MYKGQLYARGRFYFTIPYIYDCVAWYAFCRAGRLRPVKGLFHIHGSGMRQGRAAAAAATGTHLNIYGSNPVIIIPYILMYVAAGSRCRTPLPCISKRPLRWCVIGGPAGGPAGGPWLGVWVGGRAGLPPACRCQPAYTIGP